MSLPICPVPHRRGSWNAVPSPPPSWCPHWSTVWSIEDDLEDLRIVVRDRAASCLARCHWSEAFCSLSTILLASPWSLNCAEQQVPLYFLNNQRFCRPIRRNCSVDTELIDGDDCAKNQFKGVVVATKCIEISLFLCFSNLFVPKHWIHGIRGPLSLKLSIMSSATRSHFHSVCTCELRTISSLIQAQETTRARIFLHKLLRFWNSPYTILRFAFSPNTMSLYVDMKMIRPGNGSGSHCISVIMFWISARICNAVSPGKVVHSNFIGSPSIRSDSRHWDEFMNESIFSVHCLYGIFTDFLMHNTESENTKAFAVDSWTARSVNRVVLFQELCCQLIMDLPWNFFLLFDRLSCHIEQLIHCSLWPIFGWM